MIIKLLEKDVVALAVQTKNNRSKNAKQYVPCDNCKTEFLCEHWRIVKRKHLFCSKKCEGEFRKKQSALNCTCEICGKKFHRKQSHIDKYKHMYCSKECHIEAKKKYMLGKNNHQYGLRGDKNASWKSDEKISYYGYRLVRCLDHPFVNSDGFVFEHRLVAEKYLLNDENSVEINGKRYLSPEYVVHHKDFNRLNNDVENLEVMLSKDHMIFHWKIRTKEKFIKYCKDNNINYIDLDGDKATIERNGGFGSTGN